MAVYKIFASKDATIYSEYPTMNTGMDAILDLGKGVSTFTTGSSVARTLIQFDNQEIQEVIDLYGAVNPGYYLRLFLSEGEELPTDISIAADPVAQQWEMGTGKHMNFPFTTNGVSWYSASINTAWTREGGAWHTGSTVTQSFGVYENKDINLNVTPVVNRFISGTIENNGFILRNNLPDEFTSNHHYTLSYFSRDTNTIYPPVLEVRWDDSSYDQTVTGSIVTHDAFRISLGNNKEEYHEEEVVRFRLNVREQYPQRRFVTSSVYTEQKFLPPASYWAVMDVKDDNIVIDFDNTYTRISADAEGNYFDMYMNGLEPERYYKLLIKTKIGHSTIIFDDHYFFKIKG